MLNAAYLAVVQNVGAIEVVDTKLAGRTPDGAVDVVTDLTFEAGNPA